MKGAIFNKVWFPTSCVSGKYEHGEHFWIWTGDHNADIGRSLRHAWTRHDSSQHVSLYVHIGTPHTWTRTADSLWPYELFLSRSRKTLKDAHYKFWWTSGDKKVTIRTLGVIYFKCLWFR